jgi:hypothetical protein
LQRYLSESKDFTNNFAMAAPLVSWYDDQNLELTTGFFDIIIYIS